MSMLALIFLVAALILFIVAALSVPTGRFNLIAAGLACWVASTLVGAINT